MTIGLEDGRVLLYSNGTEIGSWAPEECEISESGPGSYLIVAENERLPFLPASDDVFQAALAKRVTRSRPAPIDSPGYATHGQVQEAPPRPITVIGFYLLAAVTAALGLWAVWSIVI